MSKDKIPDVEYFSVPIKQAGKINWLDHCHGSEVRALQSYAEKIIEEAEGWEKGCRIAQNNSMIHQETIWKLKKELSSTIEERDRAVEALSILLRWNEDP